MMFLLRAAFWLTVVSLLLPTGPAPAGKQVPQVGAVEAVSAAGAAVSDMTQFCTRQPGACEVGSQAAVVVGQKAQTGARMLYEFITDRIASGDNDPAAAKSPDRSPATRPSQNTLTPADMGPSWRGPGVRKEAHAKHPA
jgi:hypothetical protein